MSGTVENTALLLIDLAWVYQADTREDAIHWCNTLGGKGRYFICKIGKKHVVMDRVKR
jgi:hypothetical protein